MKSFAIWTVIICLAAFLAFGWTPIDVLDAIIYGLAWIADQLESLF